MVTTRPKKKTSAVQYWLPDPEDLDRLMQLLEICGYTDKCLAREEAMEIDESGTIIEVTVTRRQVVPTPAGVWHDEVDWFDGSQPTVCQA